MSFAPWAVDVKACLTEYEVTLAGGLSANLVEKRRAAHGANELEKEAPAPRLFTTHCARERISSFFCRLQMRTWPSRYPLKRDRVLKFETFLRLETGPGFVSR